MLGLAAVIGVLLAILVGIALTRDTSGNTQPIAGTMTLSDSDFYFRELGTPCSGSGGHQDITPAAQVTVKDGEGKLLATGSLGVGSINKPGECSFAFVVEVPTKLDFYQFEVSHRGQITYSWQDLEAQSFVVGLTLG